MILAMEDSILLKYGYAMEDFEDAENRDFFDYKRDSIHFNIILNKYFALPIQKKVLSDLHNYDKKVIEYNNILKSIDTFLGYSFGDYNYIELLDFMNSKKVHSK